MFKHEYLPDSNRNHQPNPTTTKYHPSATEYSPMVDDEKLRRELLQGVARREVPIAKNVPVDSGCQAGLSETTGPCIYMSHRKFTVRLDLRITAVTAVNMPSGSVPYGYGRCRTRTRMCACQLSTVRSRPWDTAVYHP